MQKPHAFRASARPRSAAFWSLPVLAVALGLSAAPARAQEGPGIPMPDAVAPGTTVPAADSPNEPANVSDAAGTAAPSTLASRDARASQLIGMDVRNPRGQRLGEIQDLIVDVNNQRVHYAVLAFGGFLGTNEKLFAYPVRLFQPAADRDGLVLDVNREQLREWPGFQSTRWPNWNDERYRNEVEKFHGRRPSGSVSVPLRQNMRLVRASELLDRDINDAGGNDAGEVEDIVVNLRDGSVRYMVIEFDRAWNPNDKLLALPMRAFDFPTRDDIDLRLRVDRERLDLARGFDRERWPDLNDSRWRERNERWVRDLDARAGRDASD